MMGDAKNNLLQLLYSMAIDEGEVVVVVERLDNDKECGGTW